MSAPSRGVLIEYTAASDAIILPFQYNMETMTRTRGAALKVAGSASVGGSFAFSTPMETPRVMQSAELEDETLSMELIFSAGDYMDRDGWELGTAGIAPVLDALRSLVEPRSQRPGSMRIMGELGLLGDRAFQRDVSPSVVLFVAGAYVLPMAMKSVSYTIEEFYPNLAPTLARAQIAMQIIEANNPFIFAERLRQQRSALRLKERPESIIPDLKDIF
ncbi:hypothetical protein [Hoeflea ulvae]|uniref:Uncharacterized protein n=1 Tax=Hoeflea ulvae TaxID=2983764 RepID=A0ABT3YL25_9HYPH|nr:hypothetical protein [Hoeflea ulvae]MCY0096583.1 hypothetical protein [Hoeflea ulvae]